MIKSIFPYFVLLLLCFSCSKNKGASLKRGLHPYKEAVNDIIFNMEEFSFISIGHNTPIEDSKIAYDFFKNGKRGDHLYSIDTLNNFIVEYSGYGYMYMTSDFRAGIDAWVITDTITGNRSQFVNLINQHVRTYRLYGKEVINKQPQLDTIVIPDYDRRLNKLISDLQIKDLKSLQLVLSKVLGFRIQNKEELREEATLYDISRLKGSKNYDAEEMEICEKILKKSSGDRCIYLDGYCDLYETPQRGFYQVFYNPSDAGFNIQVDLIYFECNFIRSYEPYSEKIKLDKERLGDTIKWIRPPQLRDRIK